MTESKEPTLGDATATVGSQSDIARIEFIENRIDYFLPNYSNTGRTLIIRNVPAATLGGIAAFLALKKQFNFDVSNIRDFGSHFEGNFSAVRLGQYN